MPPSTADVCGWCGTCLALLLFLAPAPVFARIVRERRVGHYDPIPYVVSLLQCGLWISYALVTPDRLTPLVTNVLGVLLQATWCGLFFAFSAKRRELLARFALVVAVWFAATSLDVLAVSRCKLRPLERGESLRTEFLGVVCTFLNILMYGAPLNAVRHVIRSRSVEYMPLPLSVMTVQCSTAWLTYAFLRADPWILIPNACGVVLGVAQLLIYGYFVRRRSPRAGAAGSDAGTGAALAGRNGLLVSDGSAREVEGQC